MFGGEEIFLVGPCWDSQADVKCRFLYNNELVQEVQGTVISAEVNIIVITFIGLCSNVYHNYNNNGHFVFCNPPITQAPHLSTDIDRLNTD